MTFDRPAFDPAQAVALARKTFEIEAAAVLGLGARIGPAPTLFDKTTFTSYA
jgi:arabinose-5-phosphate isomerase